MSAIERRHFDDFGGLQVERRCGEDGQEHSVVRGTAVVFNSNSKDLGGFVERISPEAFDDFFREDRSDDAEPLDVVALWNHDSSAVLGRTPHTLRLAKDEHGIHFELECPKSRADILESIERRDVNACSFGFVVGKGNDSWGTDADGRSVRTVNRIERFIEVSLVTHPAYPETSLEVARRSHGEYLEQRNALREKYREAAARLRSFVEDRANAQKR
jgi:HK97 family phage prohead protease